MSASKLLTLVASRCEWVLAQPVIAICLVLKSL